jgi:hypothetical protein
MPSRQARPSRRGKNWSLEDMHHLRRARQTRLRRMLHHHRHRPQRWVHPASESSGMLPLRPRRPSPSLTFRALLRDRGRPQCPPCTAGGHLRRRLPGPDGPHTAERRPWLREHLPCPCYQASMDKPRRSCLRQACHRSRLRPSSAADTRQSQAERRASLLCRRPLPSLSLRHQGEGVSGERLW